MFMCKRKLAALGWAVLSLVLLLAAGARAADVEGNSTEDDSGLYFDTGVSLYAVEMPAYTPFWRVDLTGGAPYTNDLGRITIMDDGFVGGPMIEATLGKELADQWFVETNLEFASIETESNERLMGTNPLAFVFFPYDGSSLGMRGAWRPADIQLDFEHRHYGANLVAGKTYGGDDWQLRPFAGYWIQKTDTSYRIDWQHESGGPIHNYFSEELRTLYNGLLAGVEWTFPINGGDIKLETTHGVAWAHTRYHGYYWTNASNSHCELMLDTDKPAYRGTLNISASFHEVHGWKLGLTSELRYLSYTPRIIASGQANDADFGTGPTHLGGESSFSGKLGIELSSSF